MKDNETLVKRLREKQKFYDHFLPGSNETGLLLEEAAAALEAAQQTPAVDRDALKRVIGEGMDRYWTFDYAQSPPDEENFGEEQVVVDQILTSGILQDAAELQREAEARALKSAIEALAAVVKAPRCSKCSRLVPLLSVRGRANE